MSDRPNGNQAAASWWDLEPSLVHLAWDTTERLLRRARASSAVWIGVVLAIAAALTVQRYRHPPPCITTIVLSLTEGLQSPAGEAIPTGALRSQIFDIAFSRKHMLAIARRYPKVYPKVDREPVEVADDMLEALSVDIANNDFVDNREPNDPPRSVKITLTFSAADPDVSWKIANDLTNLLVDTQVDRQRRAVQNEATASDQAHQLGIQDLKAASSESHEATVVGSAKDRLSQSLKRAIIAELALRTIDENQGIHAELVDPGHPPRKVQGLAYAIEPVLLGLPVLLFVAALLAGALDPRVLDAAELRSLGVPLLGHHSVHLTLS